MTKRRDDDVRDAYLHRILTETMTRICEVDPTEGDWCIDGNKMKVWVDASSVAIGVALEANGSIIKNVCWLCSTNDARHINFAVLDAVLEASIWPFNGRQQCCIWSLIQHACIGVYMTL